MHGNLVHIERIINYVRISRILSVLQADRGREREKQFRISMPSIVWNSIEEIRVVYKKCTRQICVFRTAH